MGKIRKVENSKQWKRKIDGKNMNENRVRIEELLYYVFLLLMMGAKGIGLTGGQKDVYKRQGL